VQASAVKCTAVLHQCSTSERTLTLLAAATGLRISECLGLQWQDLDFANQKIHVRRTWLDGHIGKPKTKASGQLVAMGTVLADLMRLWQRGTPSFQTARLGLPVV
jgi:integrase